MGTKLIDLSVVIENSAYEGPWPPEITYWDHRRGAKELGLPLGINASEFPDGIGLASPHHRTLRPVYNDLGQDASRARRSSARRGTAAAKSAS